MAGAYVHIPFCKSRCLYCDFFSTTLLEKREEYVQAVLKEIRQRKDYVRERIDTVYFGGGTPSMLSGEQVEAILHGIRETWDVWDEAEITLEANPGDISAEKAQVWHEIGVNRLSIGIQSFHDDLLRRIGRRHTAEEAVRAVQTVQEAGFDNVSIDLIYGLPGETMAAWKEDVEKALSLSIQHISAYGLMYEEGTPLTDMLHRGEVTEADEDEANAMYDYLAEELAANGFEQYEVSNFALSGRRSKHNGSYWNGTPYIGLGAGAHSYDGEDRRRWNVSDLEKYIQGEDYWEEEVLTKNDRYNERIMLSLRTKEGLKLSMLRSSMRGVCLESARPYVERGLLKRDGDRLVATREGLHILNRIIEDLMI